VWYSGKRNTTVDYREPGNEESFLVPRSSMPPKSMMKCKVISKEGAGSLNDYFHSTDNDYLPDIDGFDWEKCFVNGSGAPIINYLAKDIDEHAGTGYAVPDKPYLKTLISNAGVDLETPAKVETRKIGLFDSDKETTSFINWCQQNYDADQEKFPSGMMNVHMRNTPVTYEYYEKIILHQKNYNEPNPYDGPVLFEENPDDTGEYHMIQEVCFGNGINWCARVNLGLESIYHSDGTFDRYAWSVNKLHTDNKMLRFLLKFDFYVGASFPAGVSRLGKQLMDIYQVHLKMPKTVSINALTAAAGWQAELAPDVTTNLICNGALMRNLEGIDAQHMIIADIHDNSVVNATILGDLRFTHVTTTVLLSIITRNIFPDPEVCCAILELSQKDWVTYLIHLIITQLADQLLDRKAKTKSTTRGELLLSLCTFETDENGFYRKGAKKKEPLESLRRFSQLLPNWPSITYGGPRFLHIVRQCFIEQYEVLKSINHINSFITPNFNKEVDQDFVRVATFDRLLSPMPTVFPPEPMPGLVAWPEFADTIFKIDPENLVTKELFQEATRVNRNVQTGIYEAVRLNPHLYGELVHAIEHMDLSKYEYRFWKKVAFYDRLRLCAYRITGKNVPRSQKMEELIKKKQTFVFNEQMEAKSGELRKERKELCKAQFSRAAMEYQTPRTGVQNDIFKIKGDNYEKNKKKREKLKLKKIGERKENPSSGKTLKLVDLRDKLSRMNIGKVKDLRSVIEKNTSKDDDCHHGGCQPMDVSLGEDHVPSLSSNTEYRVVRRLSTPPPSTSHETSRVASATVTSGALEHLTAQENRTAENPRRVKIRDYVYPTIEPMEAESEDD